MKELNAKELKQYISELYNDYKRKKENFKKDLAVKSLSSKERDERIKIIKEQLQHERRSKEDDKRKRQEANFNEELCRLRRKRLLAFNKLQHDIDAIVRTLCATSGFAEH
jgi:hypothetical protein